MFVCEFGAKESRLASFGANALLFGGKPLRFGAKLLLFGGYEKEEKGSFIDMSELSRLRREGDVFLRCVCTK